jgi:hypothetical protein
MDTTKRPRSSSSTNPSPSTSKRRSGPGHLKHHGSMQGHRQQDKNGLATPRKRRMGDAGSNTR